MLIVSSVYYEHLLCTFYLPIYAYIRTKADFTISKMADADHDVHLKFVESPPIRFCHASYVLSRTR